MLYILIECSNILFIDKLLNLSPIKHEFYQLLGFLQIW